MAFFNQIPQQSQTPLQTLALLAQPSSQQQMSTSPSATAPSPNSGTDLLKLLLSGGVLGQQAGAQQGGLGALAGLGGAADALQNPDSGNGLMSLLGGLGLGATGGLGGAANSGMLGLLPMLLGGNKGS